MKKLTITTALLLSTTCLLFSQESQTTIKLSLRECVQTAVERNINVETARINKEKSAYKIAETRASLLPQVSASGNFQDNLKLPVTILPGDMLGMPGTYLPVSMGVQYTAGAAVTANQVLYNQTALTGLKLSKKADDINRLGIEKASESMAQEISKLYFLAQTTTKQKQLVEDNIARTKRLADITKTLLDNEMAKQVDYDRINVTLQNMYTDLSNTEALYEQQLNMIKYMLEIPYQQPIELTDTAGMTLLGGAPVMTNDFSNHIDMKILEGQKEVALLNKKVVNSGYMPSLTAFGQVSYQGQRAHFNDYFHGGPMSKWFASSYIGLNLSIPIFDGLDKRSRAKQAELDYKLADITMANTNERFSVDYKNAINNYFNNQSNVERQRQNIELAEKVFNETSLRYREGFASMSDLLQDEMGLSSAQANYLSALYNFKEAELQIMSLTGEIRQLFNQ